MTGARGLRSGKCEGGPLHGQQLVHFWDRYRLQELPRTGRILRKRQHLEKPGDYVWQTDRWKWVEDG